MSLTAPSSLAQALTARSLPLSIALRRGATTLPAQTFDLRSRGESAGDRRRGEGSEAVRGDPQLVGNHTADVEEGDRFTLDGTVYRVIFVHPDRRAATICDLELTQ